MILKMNHFWMHDRKTPLPLNVDPSSTVIIIQEKEAGKDASTRKPFLRHSHVDSIKRLLVSRYETKFERRCGFFLHPLLNMLHPFKFRTFLLTKILLRFQTLQEIKIWKYTFLRKTPFLVDCFYNEPIRMISDRNNNPN